MPISYIKIENFRSGPRSARNYQFQNSQVKQVTIRNKADERLFLKIYKLYFWCSMHSFRYYWLINNVARENIFINFKFCSYFNRQKYISKRQQRSCDSIIT